MQQIVLNKRYSLSFEHQGEQIRLILLEDNVALVCRKETLKNLNSFLLKEELKIFKGRLQLYKQKDIIEVIMKGKPIAILSSGKFENALNNLGRSIC